jgi:hypothetical protein
MLGAIWLCTSATQSQVLPLPNRSTNAATGSEFLQHVANLDLKAREQEVYSQVLSGNVPTFLRHLCSVAVTNVIEGKTNTATFYATPDYLAVGSDADYLLMPISPGTAQRLADALNCALPTRKMVDAIYAAAEVKLTPTPIPPSPAMTTVEVFSNHNAIVRSQRAEQLAAHPLGALVAGHKKDVVISARLASAPGKVAIYGWHRTNGLPIQPLYLGHTNTWVDYSQCTRLVQQAMLVNGKSNTVSAVLADPALAPLLSDEGVIEQGRYAIAKDLTGLNELNCTTNEFNERVTWLSFEPGVRVQINAPAGEHLVSAKKVLLVFYALPNGNTIEQTVGKTVKPGDDWHFGIQQIGAQTRFLRQLLKDRVVEIAYLQNSLKSWPAWRKQHGDQFIPKLLAAIEERLGQPGTELVLAGHSGGGSLIFGYLNGCETIPERVTRIAFLDSNYAYDRAAGHCDKLVNWLKATNGHYLCVLAYNDAVALLNGQPFVSASGGTWGKSHEMQEDLAESFAFSTSTNAEFQRFSALDGRVQFILRENPKREILHTVQVERNGFIHALLTGTGSENNGYEYFGPPAYARWIEP